MPDRVQRENGGKEPVAVKPKNDLLFFIQMPKMKNMQILTEGLNRGLTFKI